MITHICNTCGEKIYKDNIYEISLVNAEEKYDFCNWKCLLQFIIEELKKEKANTKEIEEEQV